MQRLEHYEAEESAPGSLAGRTGSRAGWRDSSLPRTVTPEVMTRQTLSRIGLHKGMSCAVARFVQPEHGT